MKSIARKLTLCALLGASTGAHAAPVLFPNGDFEATPTNDSWGQSFAGAQVITYPAAGGNPGGYADIVSNEPGNYAVLISNTDQPYPLASLGLVAGNTYTFSYDMIASVAGANKGGVKIESWSSTAHISNSGDQRVTAASTSWATYSLDYTINPTATHIKIVPLWTPNETVGFDNIGVNNTAVVPPPVVPVIPNGTFTLPGGANWSYFTDGFGLSYPPTGGNPDGNAVIDATLPGNYGVLVANNNAPQTLVSLGLTAGETYTFQMDMKVLQGPNPGGLKVEFVPTASGDLRPSAGEIAALPNPITEWNTYSFSVTLPPACTQIQVVPLWGVSSIVAFDNVKILLPGPPPPFAASIAPANAVSWTPTVAENFYQPQRSVDGVTYTNLGSAFTGTAVSSVADPEPVAFYQVLESVPTLEDALLNGGFEEDDGFDPEVADLWTRVGSQLPIRILTDAHTGSGSVRLKVENVLVDPASPNNSEIQQNVANAGGSITVGNTYEFSFWAKQISSGVSYVQQYKVSWLAAGGGIVGDGGWQNFSGANGVWEKKTQAGLVAPAGATSALIQIFGGTGAVAGGFGEVIIDDAALITLGGGSPSVLSATSAPAVLISWSSVAGKSYQVKSSLSLGGWANFGGAIAGDDSVQSVFDAIAGPRKFFTVTETP